MYLVYYQPSLDDYLQVNASITAAAEAYMYYIIYNSFNPRSLLDFVVVVLLFRYKTDPQESNSTHSSQNMDENNNHKAYHMSYDKIIY